VFKGSRVFWPSTLVAALICLIVVPAAASAATTLWVAAKAPSAPFNSCEHPGYSHIEAALGGPGTAIHVCEGTYAEQLTIERPVAISGYGKVTLELPAVTANSATPCDKASEEWFGLPEQDAISICGTAKVSIRNLNVNAVWPGEPVESGVSCAYSLNGILVAGGADLELSNSTVTGARPQLINGCQYGIGVQVGFTDTATKALSTGTAELSGDTIAGYQKNGITVEGLGSVASISKTTVTGAGPVAAIAQNGIGVQFGAQATMTKDTVSGNECENPTCGPDALTQYQSVGVYFYEAGSGSSVSKSTLDSNDVGAEAFDSTTADPSIAGDKLEGNRFEAVQIGQGSASVERDVMRNSNVGIQLLQYAGQLYAPGGTGTHDTIEHMGKWAVLGHSDDSGSDLAGSFSITSSRISGNPGPRPYESVESENPAKLKIYAEKDK
jgi:hypothetical protein